MPLAPEDEAGAAFLGQAAVSNKRMVKLPIDAPRSVLIDAINKLILDHNKLLENGTLEALLRNLGATTVMDEIAGTTQSITTAWTDITGWTGTLDCGGGTLLFFVEFTWYASAAGPANFRLNVDGANLPNDTGFSIYTNETSSHKMTSRTLLGTHVAEDGMTVKLQGKKASGNLQFDAEDKIRVTVLELPD